MYIRSFFTVIIVFCFSPLYSELYKASIAIPTEKDKQHPLLYFLYERHNKKMSTDDITSVLEALKSGEKNGEPFHLLIENVSPLIRLINKNRCHDLLHDLYILAKKDSMPNTTLEDVEVRKRINVGCMILKNEVPRLHRVLDEKKLGMTAPEHTELTNYLGKHSHMLTLQDIFNEMAQLYSTAVPTRDMFTPGTKIYDRLDCWLDDYNMRMTETKEYIEKYKVRTDISIFDIPIPIARLIKEAITLAGAKLFDFSLLKRVLELINLRKNKVMLVMGGYHCASLLRCLDDLNAYNEKFYAGNKEYNNNDPAVSNEDLQLILRMAAYDRLLESEQFEESQKMIFRRTLIGLVLCILLGISSKLLMYS